MSFSVRERLLEPRPGPTALARPRRVPLHATEKETPRHWGNNPKVAIFSSFTGPFPRHMAQRRPTPRRAAPDGWRRACRRPRRRPSPPGRETAGPGQGHPEFPARSLTGGATARPRARALTRTATSPRVHPPPAAQRPQLPPRYRQRARVSCRTLLRRGPRAGVKRRGRAPLLWQRALPVRGAERCGGILCPSDRRGTVPRRLQATLAPRGQAAEGVVS